MVKGIVSRFGDVTNELSMQVFLWQRAFISRWQVGRGGLAGDGEDVR